MCSAKKMNAGDAGVQVVRRSKLKFLRPYAWRHQSVVGLLACAPIFDGLAGERLVLVSGADIEPGGTFAYLKRELALAEFFGEPSKLLFGRSFAGLPPRERRGRSFQSDLMPAR
jgi:hypothetical protein